jgi:hypothetical protein
MSGRAMTKSASSLLRALVARSGAERDQVLVGDVCSNEWHSLTFAGERHRLALRVRGPQAEDHAARMIDRLDDAEFSIPGLLVADIGVTESPDKQRDGSIALTIEALTLFDV